MNHDSVKILENAFLISCDEAGTAGLFSVIIKGDRISSIVPRSVDTSRLHPSAERVDASGKVLLPGFIDCHYHGESYLLQLLTAGDPVNRWQRHQRYRAMDEFLRFKATVEDWMRLYRTAYYAALRSGITTLAEFGRPDNDSAFAASVEAFRTTYLRGMLTVHNGDQLEASRRSRSSTLRFSLALPPAEELTTYNLQMTMRQARDHDIPVVAHLGETDKDSEVIKRNFRKSYVQMLDDYQFFSGKVLPVHWTLLQKDDLDILRKNDVRLAISPLAASAKGFPAPPTSTLLESQISPVLGTDWGAPRPWQAMRAISRHLSSDSETVLSATSLLKMCTLDAARYLGIDSDAGSVVPGKRADLVMVQCQFPDIQGSIGELDSSRLVELVLQRISESDVTDVMVNGEFYVREGHILTYAEEDLAADVRSLLKKVPKEDQEAVVQASTASPSGQTPESYGESEGYEEGFKIVRKGTSVPTGGPILPLKPTQKSTPNQDSPVRKVYGDDEV